MMVSPEIWQQGQLFVQAVFFGIAMLFVYDLLRIFRRVATHGTVWIAVEDMFFWVISAFVLFQFLYQEHDGKVRGFVILGMFLGMLLYGKSFSCIVVRTGTFLLKKICGGVWWTCRTFMKPVRILMNPIGKSVQRLYRTGKKSNRYVKKRLKKLWKAVKMSLCKL